MSKTILIVDDEELTLMMTEGILSNQYRTLRALSGEEAIELYEQYKPDMIISDLLMPGMNGFEMLEVLKERHGRRIPIIFMTASEGEETEFQSLRHGAVDFIRKPLKADVLLKSVNTFMEAVERMRH